jgi:tRNA(Ile)-lysidine synthetase-like protein
VTPCAFETLVLRGLGLPAHSAKDGLIAARRVCSPISPALLLAVSGGADSLSLLAACVSLRDQYRLSAPLRVVTVNHNLRGTDAEEDAAHVLRCCNDRSIPCQVVTVPRGAIAQISRDRGRGIEEAARLVRYEALVNAAQDWQRETGLAPTVCLAHTRGDLLETLLYRFLQGSQIAPAPCPRSSSAAASPFAAPCSP